MPSASIDLDVLPNVPVLEDVLVLVLVPEPPSPCSKGTGQSMCCFGADSTEGTFELVHGGYGRSTSTSTSSSTPTF